MKRLKQTRELTLAQAVALAALGMILVAVGVAYAFGYPWETGWSWSAEPVPWKDRLTYAAATVTALGALVALVVSYRKQRDTEEGRFAIGFADAAAQMGNDSAAVRIAGVYAMVALADRYERHQQQCIDTLCGYLRLPYAPRNDRTTKITHATSQDDGTSTSTEESHQPGGREVRFTIIRAPVRLSSSTRDRF